MKYSLWCVLFGHRYILVERAYHEPIGGVTRTDTLTKTDFCVNCGLTKKEVGILSDLMTSMDIKTQLTSEGKVEVQYSDTIIVENFEAVVKIAETLSAIHNVNGL